MPDEPATIAEPQSPPTDPNAQLPEGFGDLASAMDKVFPATKLKTVKSLGPAPVPSAPIAPEPPRAPEPPAAPEPPKPPASDGLLPADIFGDQPPAAPEPPKPEEIPIPEGITKPKDIATWKELRSKLHAMETELPKAKAEAEKWKTQYEAAAPEELQAKIAETTKINQQMSDRIAVVDLQLHPEFQRQFTEPRMGLVQSATELIKESDIEPEQFDKAMKLTGKSRRQALDEIIQSVESPTLTGQLGVIFNQIEDLDRRRAGALADAKGNLERLQEHDKTVRYEHRQTEIKQLSSKVDQIESSLANDRGIIFLKRSGTDEEWNKRLDEENKVTKYLATSCKDQDQIMTALRMGTDYPHLYNTALDWYKRLQQANAKIAEYEGSEPSLNGIRTPSAQPSAAERGMSFAQAAALGSGLP